MAQTAKLFRNGRSQAVRLPIEFRFTGSEVAIRKDEATGEVILSPVGSAAPSGTWADFFQRADALGFPEEFFKRDLLPSTERDLL